MKIISVRPVLLSAPYADMVSNAEVLLHLPHGNRTCGIIEITLEDGTKGLGEGYLAVFAPHVFTEIAKILIPHLIEKNIEEYNSILKDITKVSGYWSLQGAARHVVSAIEIALLDGMAKIKKMPLYEYLGGKNRAIELYGSGGDSIDKQGMRIELEALANLGIRFFKIRARIENLAKVQWTIDEAKKYGITIAIDMTQNLAMPGQSSQEVLDFEDKLLQTINEKPFFIEEALGLAYLNEFPPLTCNSKIKIAGGEIITTEEEMIDRIEKKYYNIAQPDATVIGGINSVLRIFEAANAHGAEVLVHCWGGPVGMMANYHAALAGGGKMCEWPMPFYALREEMICKPWQINNGMLILGDSHGLGVILTKEVEKKYAFKKDAVYDCLPKKTLTYKAYNWT